MIKLKLHGRYDANKTTSKSPISKLQNLWGPWQDVGPLVSHKFRSLPIVWKVLQHKRIERKGKIPQKTYSCFSFDADGSGRQKRGFGCTCFQSDTPGLTDNEGISPRIFDCHNKQTNKKPYRVSRYFTQAMSRAKHNQIHFFLKEHKTELSESR